MICTVIAITRDPTDGSARITCRFNMGSKTDLDFAMSTPRSLVPGTGKLTLGHDVFDDNPINKAIEALAKELAKACKRSME